ncbi:tetratricopeptide repeat protein [Prochlorococcus marinus]|uniref:tetratricopeptide repeat protein n=1 Tax=Prochlorococcus marinus TaxID=1219 RepID=UPI0022B53B1D|nr:tetratricopeptide repeat protein [Prochlorococcus marinus]
MKTKNLYAFLISFLIIPFSSNLGITFFSLSSDIALLTKEVKATNWNTYKLNFENGYRMLNKGEYEKAIEYFNKAIKQYSREGAAYYNRGNAYSELGKSEEAIKDYLKSIELDSETGNQYAYNNISIEYDALGDYKNAIKYINLAIKAYPKDGLYFMNRGSYNLELENFDQAVKDYEKAGELYLKYKNRTSGYAECPKNKNLVHCQMDSWYYYDLGWAKENLDDLKGALDNYNKAIKINFPTEEKYFWFSSRGDIKYEIGDEEGACKDYKLAASLGDEEKSEWLNSRDGKWCKKMN